MAFSKEDIKKAQMRAVEKGYAQYHTKTIHYDVGTQLFKKYKNRLK